MSASNPPSDDYFQYYSSDPAMAQAADELDPPCPVKPDTPVPPRHSVLDADHSAPPGIPSHTAAVPPEDGCHLGPSPRLKWQDDDSDRLKKFLQSSTAAGHASMIAAARTPSDWAPSAPLTPGISNVYHILLPARSPLTRRSSQTIMMTGLRLVTLQRLCHATMFGMSENAPLWWLDGARLDTFVVVARIKEWTQRDGSIYVVIVDDAWTFRAMWDETTSLPDFTDPDPRYGDLVLLTAKLGYSPYGCETLDDSRREWLHLSILACHTLHLKHRRIDILEDMATCADLALHFDHAAAAEVEHERLDAITAYHCGPLRPISEHTWSIDLDIKVAIKDLDVNAASILAIKISIFHRLARRCQHFVRLLEIVADIRSALTDADLFSAQSLNEAFEVLVDQRTLRQVQHRHSIAFTVANPHLLLGRLPGPLTSLDPSFDRTPPSQDRA
ncbi:hypothetical protein EVJ58_g7451 [Rhodofomes roseus]|uniref:Uncharacterized protein n=1 Tax=Rhodofomes roseus TaxID=34475 RepID=A0A4Y9Y5N3_9APHY|nr:hypothetical protein EVJ58_g7451 [Rhodofomes roseus]